MSKWRERLEARHRVVGRGLEVRCLSCRHLSDRHVLARIDGGSCGGGGGGEGVKVRVGSVVRGNAAVYRVTEEGQRTWKVRTTETELCCR
jgi:hypothetical protein